MPTLHPPLALAPGGGADHGGARPVAQLRSAVLMVSVGVALLLVGSLSTTPATWAVPNSPVAAARPRAVVHPVRLAPVSRRPPAAAPEGPRLTAAASRRAPATRPADPDRHAAVSGAVLWAVLAAAAVAAHAAWGASRALRFGSRRSVQTLGPQFAVCLVDGETETAAAGRREVELETAALRSMPLCFLPAAPAACPDPVLCVASPAALAPLGLAPAAAVEALAGGRPLPGARYALPVLAASPDAAQALYAGEVPMPNDEGWWELQLAGAGDGRWSLEECLRDFLYSEAALHLGLPGTHPVAVVAGRQDMTRAVLSRLSPTSLVAASFFGLSPNQQHQMLDFLAATLYADAAASTLAQPAKPAAPVDPKAATEGHIRQALRSLKLYPYDIAWVQDRIEVLVSVNPPDEPPEGPDAAQLERATRRITQRLEADPAVAPIQEAHELVIATPGASDVLRTDREFAAFKGFLVLVTCREVHKGKTAFEGSLHGRDDSHVVLNLKGRLQKIPLKVVAEVRLPPPKREAGDREMRKLRKKWTWQSSTASVGAATEEALSADELEALGRTANGEVTSDSEDEDMYGEALDYDEDEEEEEEEDEEEEDEEGEGSSMDDEDVGVPDAEVPAGWSRYGLVFRAVARRTAALVARWQALGFLHGRIAGEGLSMAGMTTDFRAARFVEACTGDALAALQAQAPACWAVLQRLAECLGPALARREAQLALEAYDAAHAAAYERQMLLKLGLRPAEPGQPLPAERAALLADLPGLLQACGVDYAAVFRRLRQVPQGVPLGDVASSLAAASPDVVVAWLERHQREVEREASAEECLARMAKANPAYILGESEVSAALAEAAAGSFGAVERLLAEVQRPYAARA